jgi:hypothetical protein
VIVQVMAAIAGTCRRRFVRRLDQVEKVLRTTKENSSVSHEPKTPLEIYEQSEKKELSGIYRID